MNKKIYILIGLAVVLMLSATSCEDFLYQQPRLAQTTELTLSTYEGLQAATLGAYSPLYSASWYGRNFVVTADLKGGNAKISPLNSGRFRTDYLWNNTPDASHALWTRAYQAIMRANNVINVLEDGFEEVGVEQSDIDRLLGECKFIRALAYFDLARLFCQPYSAGTSQLGVPVVLITENGKPARDDLGTVYDQVELDLLDAAGKLPAVSPNAGTDPVGWITSYAAEALLARLYLYMEDWQTAADYATTVISSFPGSMYSSTDYTTWDLGGVWGTDAASEIIFEVYGSEGNSTHANWDVISYIMSPDGYGDVGASDDVRVLMEDVDVRLALFVNTANWPNDYWSLKYPGKAPDGNLREDNISVLRLSEMYLIRAEAILNGASISGVTAVGDVNMIRTNRGATSLGDVTLTDLYRERRRELCYEGHELFDLARTQRGLIRVDYDGAVNQNIPFPDYRWAMPIPQFEMDANENMVQNPGY